MTFGKTAAQAGLAGLDTSLSPWVVSVVRRYGLRPEIGLGSFRHAFANSKLTADREEDANNGRVGISRQWSRWISPGPWGVKFLGFLVGSEFEDGKPRWSKIFAMKLLFSLLKT